MSFNWPRIPNQTPPEIEARILEMTVYPLSGEKTCKDQAVPLFARLSPFSLS